MKHIIKYTPRQKEVLEIAINLAIAWRDGDIEPVYDILFKAYYRHNPEPKPQEEVSLHIRKGLEKLRSLDKEGESMGNYEVLRALNLPENGETEISEEEAKALECLSDRICRLLVGQLRCCFDSYAITKRNSKINEEWDYMIADLHRFCWRLHPYQDYSIRYSEESDILLDISETFQYQRYLNMSPKEKKSVQNTLLPFPPFHVAKEPLMSITTIK